MLLVHSNALEEMISHTQLGDGISVAQLLSLNHLILQLGLSTLQLVNCRKFMDKVFLNIPIGYITPETGEICLLRLRKGRVWSQYLTKQFKSQIVTI